MARDSPSPARALALPGRSASFFPSSARLVFRARRALRSAGVPRVLTGSQGRQSAGGRVPALGLCRRIGGARGRGWEAGLPRGRGGGGAAPSQQPASTERAARRWVRRAAGAGGGGRRAEAEVGWRARRGRARLSGPPGWGRGGRAPEGRRGGGGTRVPTPSFQRAVAGPAPPPRAPGLQAGLRLGGGAGGRAAARVFSVPPPIAHSPFPSQTLIPFGRGRNKRSRTPGSDGAGPGASVQVTPRRPAGPRGWGASVWGSGRRAWPRHMASGARGWGVAKSGPWGAGPSGCGAWGGAAGGTGSAPGAALPPTRARGLGRGLAVAGLLCREHAR